VNILLRKNTFCEQEEQDGNQQYRYQFLIGKSEKGKN